MVTDLDRLAYEVVRSFPEERRRCCLSLGFCQKINLPNALLLLRANLDVIFGIKFCKGDYNNIAVCFPPSGGTYGGVDVEVCFRS